MSHRRLVFVDDENPASAGAAVSSGWSDSPLLLERVPLDDIVGMDRWVRALMSRKNRPTVIAASEHRAEALLAVCRSAGVAVPGDLSILAVSSAGDEARAERLAMSSVLLNSHRLGEAAGDVMLKWLDGRKPKARTAVEVGTWVPRATTGPAPGLRG